MESYYDILGVAENASASDIQTAYKKLAHKHHPDRNKGDEEHFKKISEAYSTLKDSDKRAQYDQSRRGHFSNPFSSPFADASSIFSHFYVNHHRNNQINQDIRTSVSLTLEEVYFGVEKKIDIIRKNYCEACSGHGGKTNTCVTCGGTGVTSQGNSILRLEMACNHCRGSGVQVIEKCLTCAGKGHLDERRVFPIQIPRGIENNIEIQIQGEGHLLKKNLGRGSVKCAVHIEEHSTFIRNGKDLYSEIDISFIDACLGAKVSIPTINKETVELTIPHGTQYGHVFKLSNKGLPPFQNSSQFGHHFVEVKIAIPTSLTSKQKDILQQLKQV